MYFDCLQNGKENQFRRLQKIHWRVGQLKENREGWNWGKTDQLWSTRCLFCYSSCPYRCGGEVDRYEKIHGLPQGTLWCYRERTWDWGPTGCGEISITRRGCCEAQINFFWHCHSRKEWSCLTISRTTSQCWIIREEYATIMQSVESVSPIIIHSRIIKYRSTQ